MLWATHFNLVFPTSVGPETLASCSLPSPLKEISQRLCPDCCSDKDHISKKVIGRFFLTTTHVTRKRVWQFEGLMGGLRESPDDAAYHAAGTPERADFQVQWSAPQELPSPPPATPDQHQHSTQKREK